MKPASIFLDRSRQIAVQIYEILKERILSLALAPGSLLVRAQLQEEFHVSQTPIRDALLRLQEDGLVDIYPQYATLVSRIDIPHARQAQFLRLSLELEAIRCLTLESPAETAKAMAIALRQQENVAISGDYDAFDVFDRDFHRILYQRSCNPQLWGVMRRQSVNLDRLRRLNLHMPGKMQTILADHRAILEAIGAQDSAAARAALRRHLSGTLSIVDRIEQQYPDYIQDA